MQYMGEAELGKQWNGPTIMTYLHLLPLIRVQTHTTLSSFVCFTNYGTNPMQYPTKISIWNGPHSNPQLEVRGGRETTAAGGAVAVVARVVD